MSGQLDDRAHRDGFAAATVDFLLAFLTIAALVGFAAAVASDLFGQPRDGHTVRSLVAAVAFLGSYPFVAGHWSLSRFLEFGFTVLITFIFLSVLASLALFAIGGVPTRSVGHYVILTVITVAAYVLSFIDVYRRPLY